MAVLDVNPFAVLSFIAAPAILTNASSVMALGTSNRFARTVDRARSLSAQVKGKEDDPDPEIALRVRQLGYSKRRALLLVRALTAFYLAVGSFAAASLISLLGAAAAVAELELPRHIALGVALCAGVAGVGGLTGGATLLVWETRMALRGLSEETASMLRSARRDRDPGPQAP
jgi:hypothetical protein